MQFKNVCKNMILETKCVCEEKYDEFPVRSECVNTLLMGLGPHYIMFEAKSLVLKEVNVLCFKHLFIQDISDEILLKV
jgi:hypothetical protein